jgi:two-component system cell cycle response regulator CtrA
MTNGDTQEVLALREQVQTLRAKLADTQAVLPAEWKLTVTEDRVFRALLAVDCATRASIAEGAAVPETRTIDVYIARIRKKLTPFGVEIETVRDRGWRLVGRFTWQRVLNAQAA